MAFKEQIKDYFDFSKGERKGILFLLAVMLLVIILNLYSDVIFTDNDTSLSDLEAKIEEFEQFQKQSKSLFSSSEFNSKSTDSLILFLFDPNSADIDELMSLGLNKNQSQTVRNYVNKGGRFRCKSDFKKIYGISDSIYLTLYPYINLPDKYSRGNISNEHLKSYKKDELHNLFCFDPNTISNEEWMKLGFSEKQTAVIRKYINNGGKFRNKEDVKKLYVVSDEKYIELEEFILIKEENSIKEELSQIDINAFSENDFIELGGNWKKLAGRLVKFRSILGGYSVKEQLKEVYGLTNEFYNSISDRIYINRELISKMNINFIESYELSKHPYISYDAAVQITDYRNKKGPYKNVDELLENEIIDRQTFNKICPYLKVK